MWVVHSGLPQRCRWKGAGLSGEAQATAARGAARALQVLTSEERSGAMLAVAAALRRHASEILDANALDLSAAKANQTHHTLVQRLKMTEAKLETLAKGVETLADMEEPIGELLGKTELADGLVLDKVTVPSACCSSSSSRARTHCHRSPP